MCSIYQLEIIDEEIEKIAAKKHAFTAYDITKAVRARGVDIYHNEVRSAVHVMDPYVIEYEKELRTIEADGVKHEVFVFS